MNVRQNPFSLYDFLGYFTPGAVFLYGALITYEHASSRTGIANALSTHLSFNQLEIYIPFILLAYIFGHFLSFLSSITIERYSIWAFGYPSKYLCGVPHPGYFDAPPPKKTRYALRTIVSLALLPISLSDLVLGKFVRLRELYAKSVDDLLITIFRHKIETLMRDHAAIEAPSDHGSAADHDFFRYVYHYVLENAPAHVPKLQNYVALYGFLRTISLLTVILFWFLLYHLVFGVIPAKEGIALTIAAILTCYVFFMGFTKFYRRFSLEALMALTAVLPTPTPADGRSE